VEIDARRSADVFADLVAAVPFYAGLTLDEVGGRGVRWPEREAAAAATEPAPGDASGDESFAVTEPVLPNQGELRLGTYRPIWAAPECEISPALKFLVPHQQIELAPSDADWLGIAHGDEVTVAQNGTRINAKAFVRSAVPAGSAFLAEGIGGEQSANALTEPLIEVRKV
jgi:NADH-quinone oxidoreductase subunit G